MKECTLFTAVKNLKGNLWLLLSTAAALCLFLSPSLISLLVVAVIFVTVFIASLWNKAKPPVVSSRPARLVAVLIAALITFKGFDSFKTTWARSSKVGALAHTLQLSTPAFLVIVGLIGCVVGFYAIYALSCWAVIWVQMLKERLPEHRKTAIVANLKRNWYFPVSAMAFFCLNMTYSLGYFWAIPIAFIASLIAASQIPSIFNYARQNRPFFRVIALLAALGICWGEQVAFCADWSVSPTMQALDAALPVQIDLPGIVSVIGAINALYFVYICVLVFWEKMTKVLSENNVFRGITVAEWIVYSILIAASFVYVIAVFVQTEAFYGAAYPYDIIYTSDSSDLVKGNVYLALTHAENDLRQPLFAVFAAPFAGIPYLFGKLFGASSSVQAILVNLSQVILLFAANFMLAKMMTLTPIKRICFMLLATCTYTYLLFTLMMEQYIVAYFWLIFCMYLIAEKRHPDRIALWGAGGTLLASMILLPFMSDKNPVRDFKAWFADMVKYGMEFVAVMLAFCRFDIIFNLTAKLSVLSSFTGRNVSLTDKIYQYVAFISSCFVAPAAGEYAAAVDLTTWQLSPVTSISFMGVAILLLVIVSAILNRDKMSSLLAAGWAAFSIVILLVVGWGTKENGLILYALYFGWAFLLLLFQLVEKIADKLNMKFLVPVFSIGCAAALAAVNIPAVMEMVNFAIAYFPV